MKTIRDAVITPFEGDMKAFKGDIIDPNSGFMKDCLYERGNSPQFLKPEEFIREPCVWGCMLIGHFIWEPLSRP